MIVDELITFGTLDATHLGENINTATHIHGLMLNTEAQSEFQCHNDVSPLLAANMSIILPGVHTMISAPRFSSAICSEIPVPPYTHTTFRLSGFVKRLQSFVICMASSRVGVMMMAEGTIHITLTVITY